MEGIDSLSLGNMSDDEYIDDDDCDLMVDFEKRCASKEEIKTRMDQYLTATKLGRMAFVAGDIQLAKDRFNLAMSLEMQTEFENNVDFGVTGGMLREELATRCGTGSLDSDVYARFGDILSRLLQVFEHGDRMVGKRPKQPKWYLVMASCLSAVNEWDKAETVYKEGLKACPGNLDLLKAMHSLKKVNEILSELSTKAGVKKLSSGSNIDELSLSSSPKLNFEFNFTDEGSPLQEHKLRPVNKIDKRKFGSLPVNSLSLSASLSRRFSSPRSESNHRFRSKSVTAVTNIRHPSKRFSLAQNWNKHTMCFSPLIQSEKLEEHFSSRTLRTMRTIANSSDIDIIALIDDIS